MYCLVILPDGRILMQHSKACMVSEKNNFLWAATFRTFVLKTELNIEAINKAFEYYFDIDLTNIKYNMRLLGSYTDSDRIISICSIRINNIFEVRPTKNITIIAKRFTEITEACISDTYKCTYDTCKVFEILKDKGGLDV